MSDDLEVNPTQDLTSHLEEEPAPCPSCAQLLQGLRAVRSAVRALHTPVLPVGNRLRLRFALQQVLGRPPG